MKTTCFLGDGVAKLVRCQGYVTDGLGFVCRQGQEVLYSLESLHGLWVPSSRPLNGYGGGEGFPVSKADGT